MSCLFGGYKFESVLRCVGLVFIVNSLCSKLLNVLCVLQPEFNVEHFLVECRRRVSLETMRDDLGIYLKVLQSAMIELINKDYADFVNLSTNLVCF